MELCNKCKMYNPEYDDFRKSFVDTKDPDHFHFCCCYDDHIPEGIINDEQNCQFMIDKEVT